MSNVDGLRQYATDFEIDTVAISEVSGLANLLNTKSNAGHTHTLGDIPDLAPVLNSKADTASVNTALTAKADAAHNHEIAHINGLNSALGNKSDATHNHDERYPLLTVYNNDLNSIDTDIGVLEAAITAINSAISGINVDLSPLLNIQGLVIGGLYDLDIEPIPFSVNFPFLSAWEDHTINVSNWPDLFPVLHARKHYALDDIGMISDFTISHISSNSNVVYLTLTNTTGNLNLLDNLLSDLQFACYNWNTGEVVIDYNLWHKCINIETAINVTGLTVYAGLYKIRSIDIPNRKIGFDYTCSDTATQAYSDIITIPVYATASNECFIPAIEDAGIFTPRKGIGERRLDTMHSHWHDVYSNVGPNAGYGISNVAGDNSNNYNANAFKAKTIISDGVHGTPRTDIINSPRRLIIPKFRFGGSYVP